jgi:hypothetical protein
MQSVDENTFCMTCGEYLRLCKHEGALKSSEQSRNGVKMDMKIENVNKQNLKIAKQKFDEERTNAEVEFAKNALRIAQDAVDSWDRVIADAQEKKKPHLAIIAQFS